MKRKGETMINIAINGCGRIGKTLLRILCASAEVKDKITIKALNIGPADLEVLEYLITYDSLLGTYSHEVRIEGKKLSINGHEIEIFAETDATKLPWKTLGIDVVVDATGKYTKRDKAQEHINAGAKMVLISAPAHGDDITIIPGINSQLFDASKHKIISLGSCTTNAVVPLLHVLHQTCGIEEAALTTVHAYTNSQALLDVNPRVHDVRRSRAAALNIVPSTTGAMEVVERIMPELKGKVQGLSLRVPVPVVSLIDLAFIPAKSVTKQEISDAFTRAASGPLKSIMAVSSVPLVSHDFQGNPNSVTVDLTMLSKVGTLGKVFGWYDNEYGYSMRLKDFLMMVAEK
jgi:glyceraldehyde 3-phosphate dehydrogenase